MAKILLVEDDNNLREIYEARLQAEGYTIVTAQDGEEALVTAKNEKPDLVISDVMMPKISGFEMLDILRNTDGLKEVKVIMLTALGQSDDQQRADRLGADRYLVKSQVTLEDIVKVSHELLQDETAAPETAAPAPVATAPAPEPVVAAAPVVAPAEPAAPVASATPAPVVAAEPVVPVTQPAVIPEPAAAPETAAPAPVATAPAPEPVVAAPIVEPVAPVVAEVPEPVAVPEPMVSAAPAIAPVQPDAQTTDQEESALEEKIEDFINGATTEATPVAESATVTDDAVMNQAVNEIVASAPEIAPIPAEPTPAPVAAEPVAPINAPVTDTPESPIPGNDHVEIAHKKVITPLDTAPKQDINELLALEEAKEAASTATPVLPTAVVATNDSPPTATPLSAPVSAPAPISASFAPTGAPAAEVPSGGAAPATPTSPGSTGIDPNSIAL